MKVAIGHDAVSFSAETMAEIVETSDAYGDKFRLVVSAFNRAMEV